ncbi:NAD(P) transhydrogenase subunit alpha [Azospirillum lipoferum]|uniref:proton-translocating NAD(P)(+) transhydrogenase n=2 Tax=Azospirillum lipoferum TaxID=193 RepID=A0A5A9GIK1_AZOLI|nr:MULTISPECIES: NAD(P) transhydrogenase subunit alpha [Azospirillum]KAA0593544.1 NAD(P) transhydrogenase subunit alpha [Azospirillum lipoferum]MCP1608989.1 NAD(P) transhydrogenase subunit alpha [Azospirillum lipoferum]MDW5535698.1 NAD(P) transhydrogenase subunit alpha [Azospirillum sp. NL1]
MDQTQLSARIAELKANLAALGQQADQLAAQVAHAAQPAAEAAGGHGNFFVTGLTVLVLACFVGYYVVWRVTPALHSPLMAVTNAVSSVIIVGALVAAGPVGLDFSKVLGFLAVILASVNIFGGFLVTQRMLSMFKKKGK